MLAYTMTDLRPYSPEKVLLVRTVSINYNMGREKKWPKKVGGVNLKVPA